MTEKVAGGREGHGDFVFKNRDRCGRTRSDLAKQDFSPPALLLVILVGCPTTSSNPGLTNPGPRKPDFRPLPQQLSCRIIVRLSRSLGRHNASVAMHSPSGRFRSRLLSPNRRSPGFIVDHVISPFHSLPWESARIISLQSVLIPVDHLARFFNSFAFLRLYTSSGETSVA